MLGSVRENEAPIGPSEFTKTSMSVFGAYSQYYELLSQYCTGETGHALSDSTALLSNREPGRNRRTAVFVATPKA